MICTMYIYWAISSYRVYQLLWYLAAVLLEIHSLIALNLFVVLSIRILGVLQNSRTYSQFKKSYFGISIKVSAVLYVCLLINILYIVLTRKLGNVGLKVQRLQESKLTYRQNQWVRWKLCIHLILPSELNLYWSMSVWGWSLRHYVQC